MKGKLSILSLLLSISVIAFATDNRKHLEEFSKESEYEELMVKLEKNLCDYYRHFYSTGTSDDYIFSRDGIQYGPDGVGEDIEKSIDGIMECQQKLETFIAKNGLSLSESSASIIQKQSMISAKESIEIVAEWDNSYSIPRIVRKHDYLCNRIIKAKACCCKDATKELRNFALKAALEVVETDDFVDGF